MSSVKENCTQFNTNTLFTNTQLKHKQQHQPTIKKIYKIVWNTLLCASIKLKDFKVVVIFY